MPWLAVALVIALLDQVSKIWIESLFHRGERLPVTEFFNLVLVYNRGAAFSFLADAAGWQRYVLVAIALLAVMLIVGLLLQQTAQGLYRVALTLILGGALGSVEGCTHLTDRAPAKRKRDVLLELAHEHVRRQARVAHLLGQEQVPMVHRRKGGGTMTARRFERER